MAILLTSLTAEFRRSGIRGRRRRYKRRILRNRIIVGLGGATLLGGGYMAIKRGIGSPKPKYRQPIQTQAPTIEKPQYVVDKAVVDGASLQNALAQKRTEVRNQAVLETAAKAEAARRAILTPYELMVENSKPYNPKNYRVGDKMPFGMIYGRF